jgi:hypothetical protein
VPNSKFSLSPLISVTSPFSNRNKTRVSETDAFQISPLARATDAGRSAPSACGGTVLCGMMFARRNH